MRRGKIMVYEVNFGVSMHTDGNKARARVSEEKEIDTDGEIIVNKAQFSPFHTRVECKSCEKYTSTREKKSKIKIYIRR